MNSIHLDEPLLRRFIAGESSACRLVERWAREFVRYRAFGIPSDDADDLVQQSVALLWNTCRRGDFELRVGLRALLRRIAYARSIDWIRRRRPNVEPDENLPDTGNAPETGLELREELDQVRRAIQHLAPGSQELLRLHFLDERPYAELSSALGSPEGTLRSRVFESIRVVRRRLAASGSL